MLYSGISRNYVNISNGVMEDVTSLTSSDE